MGKRILNVVFFVFAILATLNASYLKVNKSGFQFEFNGYLLEMHNYRFSINGPVFSYGQIDRSGLIKTLKDPYSSKSLLPKAMSWNKNGEYSGSVLNYRNASIAFGFGKRPFASITIDGGDFFLMGLFAFKNNSGFFMQESISEKGESRVFYLGASYKNPYFDGLFLFSLLSSGRMDFFFNAKFSIWKLEAELSYGNIASIYKRDKRYNFASRIKLFVDSAYLELSMKFGEMPIYSYEHMLFDLEVKGAFEIEDASFSLSMMKRIDKMGRRDSDYKVSFEYLGFNMGYKGKKGIFYSIPFKEMTLVFENGVYKAAFRLPIKSENAHIEVSFSSAMAIDVELLLYF